MNNTAVEIGVIDVNNEITNVLNRYSKYLLNGYYLFRWCDELSLLNITAEIGDYHFIAVTDKLFSEKFDGEIKKGVMVLVGEYIRYKRFSEVPVLFITSEEIEYLYILARNGLSDQALECVSCGRGNIHLKMPFEIQDLVSKIEYVIQLSKTKPQKDNLIYLLHCQTKAIIP